MQIINLLRRLTRLLENADPTFQRGGTILALSHFVTIRPYTSRHLVRQKVWQTFSIKTANVSKQFQQTTLKILETVLRNLLQRQKL
jgi:hypothetical protein